MPIVATRPVTVPPTDEKVFDTWYITQFQFYSVGSDVRKRKARIVLELSRELLDGSFELSPGKEKQVLDIDDLEKVATDRFLAGKPLVAQTTEMLISAVNEYAGDMRKI